MENIVVIPFTGHKIVNRDNRPLHGFRRHLGCGAFAANFTANVWKILQISTLITSQLHVGFDEKCVFKKVMIWKLYRQNKKKSVRLQPS